jgi:hypothetical protein
VPLVGEVIRVPEDESLNIDVGGPGYNLGLCFSRVANRCWATVAYSLPVLVKFCVNYVPAARVGRARTAVRWAGVDVSGDVTLGSPGGVCSTSIHRVVCAGAVSLCEIGRGYPDVIDLDKTRNSTALQIGDRARRSG